MRMKISIRKIRVTVPKVGDFIQENDDKTY